MSLEFVFKRTISKICEKNDVGKLENPHCKQI